MAQREHKTPYKLSFLSLAIIITMNVRFSSGQLFSFLISWDELFLE